MSSFNWPFIGPIKQSFAAKQFCYNLGLLISNGVPVMRALQTLEKTETNTQTKTMYVNMIDGLKNGRSLSELCREITWLPTTSKRLVTMGEKTGKLGDTLLAASTILENKNKDMIRKLSRILTPALTLITGLIIGLIVISVLSAILSINDFA